MPFATWRDESLPWGERRHLYYASREWGLLKQKVHDRAGGKCERCRINGIDAVHHLNYKRMFRENLDDLQAICDGCHEFSHGRSHHDPLLSTPTARQAHDTLRYWGVEFRAEGENLLAGPEHRLDDSARSLIERFRGDLIWIVAPPPPPSIGSIFDEPNLITDLPPLHIAYKRGALALVANQVRDCTRCPELCANRTNAVPGEGSLMARLMIIGEGPGQTEDETGRPFVGRAGKQLDAMISGMGIRREDVFISNVVKCRPPDNRDPSPSEVRNCIGYLERQIEAIRPEFLCLLGKPAAQTLLNTSMPMGRLRGKWQRYRGIPTICTWHPAYLLRNPAAKVESWQDLQMLMKAMGLPVPVESSP